MGVRVQVFMLVGVSVCVCDGRQRQKDIAGLGLSLHPIAGCAVRHFAPATHCWPQATPTNALWQPEGCAVAGSGGAGTCGFDTSICMSTKAPLSQVPLDYMIITVVPDLPHPPDSATYHLSQLTSECPRL